MQLSTNIALATNQHLNRLLRRNIWSSLVRMEEAMRNLEKNPYFKKYEQKIIQVQKSSPSEFLSQVSKAAQKKKDEIGGHSISKVVEKGKIPLPKAAYAFAPQKRLDNIMKVDLLKSKTSEEIQYIWTQYFQLKDAICGVMKSELFDKILDRATLYPMFLLPVLRSEGYEFVVTQFAANEIHFTPLVNYQAHHENAPECLTMTHYPDLATTKGIVLMHGEFNKDIINAKEAQLLANQIQLYYGGEDKQKLDLLKNFHSSPDTFKHMDLVAQLENIDISTFIKAKSKDIKLC